MISNQNLIEKFNSATEKKILILGVGGIGSILCELLVRAGFKNLCILDFDNVEESNLIRQSTYFTNDIGKSKVDVLAKYLKKINKNINVEKLNLKVESKQDIFDFISNCDFVISSLDKPIRTIRRIVNEVCVELNKPVLFAGFAEHVGMVGPFIVPHKTACLNCLNDMFTPDESLNNVLLVPSYGPLCNLIASIVADEVINYFVKFKNTSLQNKTLMLDLISYKTTIKKWKKSKSCCVCGGLNDSKKHI